MRGHYIKPKYDRVPEEFTFEEVEFSNNDEKKMNKFKKVYRWLVVSSVNSDKFSLTLKAGIPFLVLLGVSDTETLEELSGAVGVLLVNIGQVIAGAIALIGLIRKVWLTYK